MFVFAADFELNNSSDDGQFNPDNASMNRSLM
jgi:hypothetical protein